MIYLLITSILWSLTYGLTPRVLSWIDPLTLSSFYMVSGCLLFLPLAGLERCARSRFVWMAIGMVQWGLMSIFLQMAFSHMAGHMVALLCTTTPIYVALCDDLLSGRFSPGRFFLAFLSVLLVWLALGGLSIDHFPWLGIGYGEAANLCYGLGQILYRRWCDRLRPSSDLAGIFWMFLGSCLLTVVILLLVGGVHWPEIGSGDRWAALIFLGPVCCGLGNLLWNCGLRRVSTAMLIVFNNLSIPLGLLLSALLFHESLSWGRILLALCGLVCLLAINGCYSNGRKDLRHG